MLSINGDFILPIGNELSLIGDSSSMFIDVSIPAGEVLSINEDFILLIGNGLSMIGDSPSTCIDEQFLPGIRFL